MSETKVLNLYAGIGGNRKLWDNVDVTAVEWDEEKAEVYRDNFPSDTVVVSDAHEYLVDHYHEYDFIWSSPPCPSHSDLRMRNAGPDRQNDPIFPDMKLYEEIIFLKHYFSGDYAVENVQGYYEPLVTPQRVGRHYIWSNFHIRQKNARSMDIHNATVSDYEGRYGLEVSDYEIKADKKLKMMRNCVEPELGKHVFESRTTQDTLPGVVE